MEAYLMEKMNMKQTAIADIHAGITGDRISLDGVKRVTFLIAVGAGTAATAFAAGLLQHDAASAGVSKALSISNVYYHKVGLATSFTKVAPSVAANSYDLQVDLGDNVALIAFEVLAEDLDRTNGFSHVSCDLSGAGTGTRQGVIIGIIDDNYKPSYGNAI